MLTIGDIYIHIVFVRGKKDRLFGSKVFTLLEEESQVCVFSCTYVQEGLGKRDRAEYVRPALRREVQVRYR